ncbi:MAG TPA: hypothetical protein VK745_01620 [Polyangiaceae bacterium]|jgi:hypothetical protein|nr:hypothetical protein [Polyangiaceae bacterium]
MRLGIHFCALVAAFAIAGCSSSTDSNSASSGGGAGISPGTHDRSESCPDGDVDCKTGLVCASEDPNGQCIQTCTPFMDAECGDTTQWACNSEGHCYPRCTTTADCARASEGYICKDDEPPRPPVKFCDGPN